MRLGNLMRKAKQRFIGRECAVQDTQHTRAATAAKYSLALRKAKASDVGLVVDIGVGRGNGIKDTCSSGIFIGVDRNPLSLSRTLREVPEMRGRLVLADAAGIPFRNLGAITAFELIEHLDSAKKEAFMCEAKNALRPGGWFFASTPLDFGPIHTMNVYHLGKELGLPEFKSLIERHFREVEYYGLGAVPKSVSKRLLARASQLLYSVDLLNARKKLVPKSLRSRILSGLGGKAELVPLSDYLRDGRLPKTIIAAARK